MLVNWTLVMWVLVLSFGGGGGGGETQRVTFQNNKLKVEMVNMMKFYLNYVL